MGREIVYCFKCQTRLMASDFDKGGAVRFTDRVACVPCASEHMSTLSPEEKAAAIKPDRPATPAASHVTRRREKAPATRKPPVLLFAIAGGAVVVVAAVLLLSGGRKPAPPPEEPPPPPAVVKPVEAPKEDPREAAARAAADKAAKEKHDAAEAERRRSIAAAALAKEVRDRAAEAYAHLKARAEEARRKGDAAEEKKARDAVAALGRADLTADLDALLAGIAAPKAMSAAYLVRWQEAALRAGGRELEAAAQELERAAKEFQDEELRREAAADAAAWRKLQAVVAGALKRLAELPRGQNVALVVGEDKVAGTVVQAGPARIGIADAGGALRIVELEDLSIAALVELLKEGDPKVLAIGCLLAGDAEAAERFAGDQREAIAPRYWDHAPAAKAKRPRPAPRELEARKLFHESDRESRKLETLGPAVGKARTLLADYADTRLVKAERAEIDRRAGLGREYLFAAAELRSSGGFLRAKHAKAGATWTCGQDTQDVQNTWIEVRFAAVPEAAYKMWAYVGACCAETFAFDYQATELTGPNPKSPKETALIEPDGNFAAPLKHGIRYLKTTHAAHGGPKEPSRWEWVQIPLPKFASAGLKKVRLLTGQKGFSVAWACVSVSRSGPPGDAEMKEELAKPRAEPEGVAEGLVGWWKLDEAGGSAAMNAVEGGAAGVVRKKAGWGEGIRGGALVLDGEGGYVEVPSAAALDQVNKGDYSLAAWFKPENSPPGRGDENRASYGILVKSGWHTGLSYNFEKRFSMTHWHKDAQVSTGTWEEVFEPGAFHHVAGVLDHKGGTVKLYVNGALRGTQAFAAGTVAKDYGQATWKIGIGGPGQTQWEWPAKGAIDDVRIYSRALTAAEAKQLYDAGKK